LGSTTADPRNSGASK
jgi:hypothetical protein